MWSRIEKYFRNYPAQAKVARLLFERGFQVKENGRIVSGNIEIPYTQIAKEVGVDRRAVVSTVRTILSTPELRNIYSKLRQVCLLQEAAREFGLSVITFIPENARRPGIIAEVTRIVSEKGLTIIQAYAEDPDVSTEPRFIMVIQGDIPPDLINELRRVSGARSITVY